jgi:hypothetical protein
MSVFRPIKSIIGIVAFLVLIAVAAIVYSGDENKEADMEQDFFYRQTKTALDFIFGSAQGLVDLSLEEGAKDPVSGALDSIESKSGSDVAAQDGFWARIVGQIKEEWETGGEIEQNNFVSPNSDVIMPEGNILEESRFADYFNWEKNEDGLAIIFKTKKGEEYKIPLPFKFFGKSTAENE